MEHGSEQPKPRHRIWVVRCHPGRGPASASANDCPLAVDQGLDRSHACRECRFCQRTAPTFAKLLIVALVRCQKRCKQKRSRSCCLAAFCVLGRAF